MTGREMTKPHEARESAEERRSRESAREVAEWETAFATAKGQQGQGPPAKSADTDRANAGAMVSRAHRAEKSSGGSRNAARPDDWAADTAE